MQDFMDNPTYQDGEKQGTELKVVTSVNGSSNAASQSLVVTTCSPEVCRAARQRYQPPDLDGGPWHKKKTYFLIGTIVLLIVWIVIFSTLSQLKLL